MWRLPIGRVKLKLTAVADLGGQRVTKEVATWVADRTVENTDTERVASKIGAGLAVASMAETAPLAVAATEEKVWETSLGANLQLPVTVAKAEGLNVKDKVIVRVDSLAGLGKKKPQADLGKDKVDGALTIPLQNNKDENQFRAGTHSLKLLVTAKIDYRRHVAAAGAAAERHKAATAEAEAKKTLRDGAKAALDAARNATAETEQAKADRVAAAEAALKAAEEALAVAEAARVEAEAASKAAAERAKPKEIVYESRSLPITVKIAPSPVKLSIAEPATVAKGAKVEVPVNVQRLYGFADEVKLGLKLPEGTKGVAAPEVAVPKEAADGKLVIEATGEAAVGELALEVVAKMKFNGVDLEERAPLKLTVSEP